MATDLVFYDDEVTLQLEADFLCRPRALRPLQRRRLRCAADVEPPGGFRDAALLAAHLSSERCDLRPGPSTTGEFDQPANSRGSLPHARQTPVSLSAGLEHLRVDFVPED